MYYVEFEHDFDWENVALYIIRLYKLNIDLLSSVLKNGRYIVRKVDVAM